MSTHSVDNTSEERAITEALEWYGMFRERVISPAEFAEWEEWLAFPENRRAYDEVERMLRGAKEIGGTQWPTPGEVDRDDYRGDVSVRDWHATGGTARRFLGAPRWPSRGARVALAAAFGSAVIVAVFIGFLLNGYMGNVTDDSALAFETGKAEHRVYRLPDGSEVFLGAESSVVVSYHDDVRSVVLDRGQAFFDVAKEKSRKFIVTAGPTTVQALGTRFSVQKEAHQVKVAVVTGTVQVTDLQSKPDGDAESGLDHKAVQTSAILRAGQQVRNGLGYDITTVESIDIDDATSWRVGRLKFTGDRLDLVVAAVNRYSDREIVIRDNAVAELSFTGTVFQNNIEEWLHGLEQALPVKVEDAGGRKIILALASD